MGRFFLICLAGGLGTGVRYLTGLAADRLLGRLLPFGTLVVNIAGCFLISLVLELALRTTALSPTMRLVLTTGFMGGLTTYSSFNHDYTRFLLEGQLGKGALYVFLTLLLCLGSGVFGLWVGRTLSAPLAAP